jgi:tetratricopeptide (TPR) repeat protein
MSFVGMGGRAWLALAAACFALSVARRAAAEDDATAKARVHLRAGIADYDEGRYTEAANEMEQAYALRPLPDLQYDLAQCYERLGRLEDAAKAYESYVGARRDAPDLELVRKRIENLHERAKAVAAGQEAAAQASTESVKWRTIVRYVEVPPPPGRVARAASYGLFALGAAGVATGIAFAVLTAQASNKVHGGGNLMNPPSFDTQSATQNAARLYPIGTGIGFGVGALAVGGGIGLFLAGRRLDRDAQKQRDSEQASLTGIAPYFNASGGGVAMTGAF